MRLPVIFILLLAAAGLAVAAGCTQGSVPQAATAVPSSPAPDLRAIALAPSDLPSCFTRTAEEIRRLQEVGSLARDLGWQAGYAATFTCPGAAGPTVIRQSLAVYPADNIPAITAMVDRQDRSDPGLVYGNLSLAESGMRGFYGRNASTAVKGAGGGPGALSPGQDAVAEIIFWRGNTFGVLEMSGPATNATLLEGLARTASTRLG